MRYAIDLDGVLANFGARVIEAANSIWPGKIPPGFVPSNWDYVGTLTPEEWKEVWAKIKSTPYLWEAEPPAPGVEELRDFLISRNRENTDPLSITHVDEIYFITARAVTVGESPMVQTAKWLARFGLWPRNGYSTVIPVAEAEHKKQLFQGLGLKFMLDDYAPTVEALNSIKDKEGNQFMRAYVLDQPWNRYATDLPRVFSVTEYLDTIHKR